MRKAAYLAALLLLCLIEPPILVSAALPGPGETRMPAAAADLSDETFADLSIEVTDGLEKAAPGLVTYTIVARNIGPLPVTDAQVSVDFPLVDWSADWTCTTTGGATCAGSGSGDIDDTVDLPAGSTITYTATVNITGVNNPWVETTAQVTPPAGVTDPDPSNNMAADNTVLDQPPWIGNLSFDPAYPTENDIVELTFEFTDYNLPETHQVTIDWDDGEQTKLDLAIGEDSVQVSHRYLDNPVFDPEFPGSGYYHVHVTVTEPDGDEGEREGQLTVYNAWPDFTAALTPVVYEGQLATLSGVITDTGTLDSHTLEVHWVRSHTGTYSDYAYPAGDHPYSESYRYLDDPYGEDDTVLVDVTLTDDDGFSREKNLELLVRNLPPVVDAGPDAIMRAGEYLWAAGSFEDPGIDQWSATVDYGDGSGVNPLFLSEKGFVLIHQYTLPGDYTVAVTVEDEDGGRGQDTVQVTVPHPTDLSMEMTGPSGAVLAGREQVFKVTAANLGPHTENQVTIRNWFSNEFSFVSASPGCSYDFMGVTCPVGTLQEGETAQVEIIARVRPDAWDTAFIEAFVTGDRDDPDLENNYASAELQVRHELYLPILGK